MCCGNMHGDRCFLEKEKKNMAVLLEIFVTSNEILNVMDALDEQYSILHLGLHASRREQDSWYYELLSVLYVVLLSS